MNLQEQGFRFYCGDGECTWRRPIVKEDSYAHHIDCTDMSDEEFIEFLDRGGEKVCAKE